MKQACTPRRIKLTSFMKISFHSAILSFSLQSRSTTSPVLQHCCILHRCRNGVLPSITLPHSQNLSSERAQSRQNIKFANQIPTECLHSRVEVFFSWTSFAKSGGNSPENNALKISKRYFWPVKSSFLSMSATERVSHVSNDFSI